MVGSLMYLGSIGCSGVGASFTFSKIPTMYAVASLADRTGRRHQEQKTPPVKMVYAVQWWTQEMQFYLDGQDEEAGRLLQIELMVRSKVAGDSPFGTARVPISTLMANSTAIGLLKVIRCKVRTSDGRPVGVLTLPYVIHSYPAAGIPPPPISNVGYFNHPLLLAPARENFSVRKKFNVGHDWWNLEESLLLRTNSFASHQFGECGECSDVPSSLNTSWSAWGVNHFSPAYYPAASPAVGFYREQQPALLPYPVSELDVRGQFLSKPEIHVTQNQTDPSEEADLPRMAEKAGKSLQTIPQSREPAVLNPLPDLDVQGQLLSKPEIHGTQNQTDPIEKADLARIAEKSGKSLQTVPQSQEVAVQYPLLDLDVQGQLLSKPEIHGTQNQTDPIEKADLARIEEKTGKSLQTILESQGFASEKDGGFIFDTSVGKIDLSNLQVLDNKDIVEVKELGSGAFGTVYHGKWRGIDVAIKRINKNCFTSQQDRLILESLKEVGILANLLHPNIVSLYGIVLDELGSNTLAIVTELVADGSLRNILHREDKFDHYRKLIIAKGAASGMEYLHLKKIVHFDLKCDNLLVDLKDPSSPICKVADFGLSKVKQDTLVSGGVRGTIPWMAPELLKGDRSKVSEKVDVFSFGIVMWEIITGEVPYAGMLEGEILGGIYNDTLRPPMPTSCEPRWRRLIEECWASNPQERPSFTQIARQLHLMLVDSHAEAGQ